MKTFAAALLSLTALCGTATAGDFWVNTQHSRLYTSDQAIASVVIGDPSVADITVKSNTEVMIFGRSPGATNLTLFGPDGELINVLEISVRNTSANRVLLQSGSFRYSFNCTDICEQTPTIGDGSNETRLSRNNVLGQATDSLKYNQQAVEAATGGRPSDPTGPNLPPQGTEAPDAKPGS